MTITYELDLNDFEPWSGAINTFDRIQREGKCKELEAQLEELYPDGMTETELNDLLWFNSESVFEWLGLRTESQVESDISDKEDEISDKKEDIISIRYSYEDEVDEINSNRDIVGMNPLDKEERIILWKKHYAEEMEELKEELKELYEELKELKEELKEVV